MSLKNTEPLTSEQIRESLLASKLEELKKATPQPAPQAVSEHRGTPQNRLVSLFTGAGGLDLGVKLAAIQSASGEESSFEAFRSKEVFNNLKEGSNLVTIYTNDSFKEANETYTRNLAERDTNQDSRDIRKVEAFPESEILAGGFPCPGYSLAGPRLINDKRNFLYLHFVRAVAQSQPLFFIAENVKGLLTLGDGEVLKQIVEDFSAIGYEVTCHLTNAVNYGVPQLRERVFIIGKHRKKVADSFTYSLPAPTHSLSPEPGQKPAVTLKAAIEDLEEDPGPIFEGTYSSMYTTRNRKKSWDSPSFTIQATGRQAPQHPAGEPMKKEHKDLWVFQGAKNRRLSAKEIARIQTFPDWYMFSDGGTGNKETRTNKIYKQVGNAVPPLLAKAVTQPITDYLHGTPTNKN